MRYIDCCKSTKKNKKCTRKDGKHFSLQRRFTKKKMYKRSSKRIYYEGFFVLHINFVSKKVVLEKLENYYQNLEK